MKVLSGDIGGTKTRLRIVDLATGGVYIAGGIAPQNTRASETGDFLQAFCAKGRMATLMQDIPDVVVLNTDIVCRGSIWARISRQG